VVLRREVAVERAEGDLCTVGDLAHLDRVVPAFRSELDRCVEDPFPAGQL
jgi:hypothetical protein